MLSLALVLDEEECISSFRADGHAEGAAKGANIACAALSVLSRTAWESFAAIPGLKVEGRAEGEGKLSFELGPPGLENVGLVKGVSLFLLTGLAGLERDFPGQVGIEITRMRRESHGS